jgi:hypothetical protein
MKTNRREWLLQSLLGAQWLGLRALATGLPASFLLRAGQARGEAPPVCPAKEQAQFLILSVNSDGDPLNANAPGTYEDPAIVHPDPVLAPAMAAAPLRLGAVETVAAQPWSQLPQWALDRSSFFHLATMTTIHPDLPKVLRLMGDLAGQEMLPGLFSRCLAGCLGTVQAAPASLVGAARPELITHGTRVVPNLNAIALRDILVHPAGPLTDLAQLRDRSMDRLHARLKAAGGATPAQRAFIDGLALSRQETRAISDRLVDNLAAVEDNDTGGQIVAAVTLIAMKVTPVVVIRIPFGGDNHADPDLAAESVQTQAGVQAIGTLMDKLREHALEDRVTFATLNVFGRTLKQLGRKGRNHWADHQVSMMIGKGLRGGVVGGVAAGASGDYAALPIDSRSGRGDPGGDIPASATLSAFAKTLGAALGVPQGVLDASITRGRVVAAALAG